MTNQWLLQTRLPGPAVIHITARSEVKTWALPLSFGLEFSSRSTGKAWWHKGMGERNLQRGAAKIAVTKPELQRLLTDLPFIRSYGFRVRSIAPGECVLAVPFQPTFERPGGIVSGLVFMAAADVAMWLAIKTLLGSDDGCVTAEMKTSFLSAAKQQDFCCRAKILKLGKRLVYGVAECASLDHKLLTHHTLTYIRPGGGAG